MLSKRFVYFFTCVLAAFLFFPGCAPQQDEDKVVIWHWMSDRQESFEELASAYEAETGIKVRFEVFFPPDIYMQKIQAAAAADDLPDLFGILESKKIFGDFIEAGYVENITEQMDADNGEWKDRFIDITVGVNTFEPGNIYNIPAGIYGVPIDSMSMQFLYNSDLLLQAGFDPAQPPATFGEFLAVSRAAKEKLGVNGFVCGWGESWLIYSLVTNYAYNVMGEEKFFATLRGEVPYTDPGWVAVFALFRDMVDAGILAPGIVTLSNKEAEQIFATNQAVFSFNGSWGINTYLQMNPDLKYDTMLPPELCDTYPIKIWAGAGSSFLVNPASKVKQQAVDFLKWFTQSEQQTVLMEKTHNLPSVKMPEGSIPPFLGKFFKHMDRTTHQNLWPLNEHPRVVEAINTGIQKILVGEKTPQEVASDVQKVKQNFCVK